ncbi:MAG TPA: redoxin domain-containing protein [Candidatus Acidoferrales bacterium]|nr:redoxin domain-containing protein [Candidatus Acidoferrales bacterium]
MNNHAWAGAVAFLAAASIAGAGQSDISGAGSQSESWSGVIVSASCNADEAFAEAAKCTAPASGTPLALYDDTTRQVFALDPQNSAKGHLGDSVTIEGQLVGTAIHVASLRMFSEVGLRPGQKAPDFSARDQFGKTQTLETLRGAKGTVLLFYRSADWCPYCKGQLIQLQAAKERFEKQGIKLAGISYDSVEILKFFSERRKIEFPLLSDPDSKIIRMYQVLNAEAIGPNAGMARPGYFFIDPQGVIREKFFEAKYRERLTGNNVLSKLFPELGEEVSDTVDAPHLQLRVGQSDRMAVPGNLVTLTAEVHLPPDVHVYAPGTKGYKTVKLTIDPLPDFELRQASYPAAKILYLPAIRERVPVFEGFFRIRQELKVNSMAEFSGALSAEGKKVTVKGTLDYQACDSKICFLPASVPVEWQLQIEPLDRQRAPDNIRHK